ncbi:MAG: hypothetical protein EPO21_21770 [Chloroflexota bacterium]|nr:MAG: hypothetical protein EPO21_21770 [Chloroflexota bacterium]
MLGVSAFWGHSRGLSVPDLVHEALSLGFGGLELDGIRGEGLQQLRRFIHDGVIKAPSVHDPCSLGPLYGIIEPPQGDWLASRDADRRHRAVECGKRSIELAASLGANAVVIHSGKVKIPSYQHELNELLRSVGRDAPEYQTLMRRGQEERDLAKAPHIENVLRSLEQLGLVARDLGIRLGIETRVGYIEVPDLAEMKLILDQLSYLPLYYWHDAGHAQIMENLGFESHEEFLRTFSDRLIGIHLHDAEYGFDHMAPGMGKIDFDLVARYVPPDAIKVIEPFHAVTYDQMKRAVAYLREHGLE